MPSDIREGRNEDCQDEGKRQRTERLKGEKRSGKREKIDRNNKLPGTLLIMNHPEHLFSASPILIHL